MNLSKECVGVLQMSVIVEKEKQDVKYHEKSKNPDISTWDNVAQNYSIEIQDSERELGNEIVELLKQNNILPGSKLLELGSGSGHLSACLAMAGYETALLDFSPEAMNKARQTYETYNLEGDFILGDMMNLDVSLNNRYDLVWNSGVMEHFSDDTILTVFQRMKELSTKRLLIVVPNPLSVSYLIQRYILQAQSKWDYGNEYLRTDYTNALMAIGAVDISIHYLAKKETKFKVQTLIYESEFSDAYADMLERDLLPSHEKYLVAYFASLSNERPNKEQFVNLDADVPTQIFNLNAERYGLAKKFELLQSKNDLLKNEKKVLQDQQCELIKTNEALLAEKNNLEKLKNSSDNNALYLSNQLNSLYNSRTWKMTMRIKGIAQKTGIIVVVKAISVFRRKGIRGVIEGIRKQSSKTDIEHMQVDEIDSVIIEKLKTEIVEKRIVIFPPTIDWDMPLFQRPQQLALAYAKKPDFAVVYLTMNQKYDNVKNVIKIDNKLWVINQACFAELAKIIEEYACEIIQSISWTLNIPYINKIRTDKLIYEYIDEIEIFHGYDEQMKMDHELLLKTADVTVCTATKLFEKAKDIAANPILSTNGVDYDFFAKTIKTPVNKLIENEIINYDYVLGYYGALASWFDYNLVAEIARTKPNWLWVLVGVNYDGSLDKSGILHIPNVMYIPPQNYQALPSFLTAFDIATIPFLLNEITLSTSPVKIFEYMAGGKPILASCMPECLKYKSAYCYKNVEEFIVYAEELLTLDETDVYWETLKKEALANTWETKTNEILLGLGIGDEV